MQSSLVPCSADTKSHQVMFFHCLSHVTTSRKIHGAQQLHRGMLLSLIFSGFLQAVDLQNIVYVSIKKTNRCRTQPLERGETQSLFFPSRCTKEGSEAQSETLTAHAIHVWAVSLLCHTLVAEIFIFCIPFLRMKLVVKK